MWRRSAVAALPRRWHSREASALALARSASTSAGPGGAWRYCQPPQRREQVLLGAVSYDPAVSRIWELMRAYMNGAGVPFDFVLFTNYEQQVAALLQGHIDIAWNGPVAHVLSQHLAGEGATVSLGMRDVDRDFASVCVARLDAGVSSPQQLDGKTVATGSSDSPQAHLVPLQWLGELKVNPAKVVPFDIDLGKHGDTALGEIAAMEALLAGKVQAALLSEMMWKRGLQGKLPSIDSKALASSVAEVPGDRPTVFDHCQFDALSSVAEACPDPEGWKAKVFSKALFAMDMQNPAHTEVMRLEGIRERWVPPREEGYTVVRRALAPHLPQRATGFAGQRRAHSSAASAAPSGAASSGAAASGKRPSVGVVGAGVAGLQTVRALRAKGFEVTAFEKASTVGGVWRANYLNFGVQVPKQLYEFPDFPHKEVAWGEYQTGPQVQQYIEDFTDHFGLRDSVRTRTAVEAVVPTDDGWTFTTKEEGGVAKTQQFDYCVVATGMYSAANTFIPSLPQRELFKGEVLHSSDFRSPSQVEGKRVVVIGGGKSAVDCAVECAKVEGTTVTLLSRKEHWPTPRLIAGLIPFQYVFLSRLGQSLVIGHKGPLPGAPSPMKEWHQVGWPVMAAAFKAVEGLFALQFRQGVTSPFGKVDIVEDFYGFAQVLDYSLRDLVKAGAVDWRIGAAEQFTAQGVQVGGDEIPADVVISATGFGKDYSIFPAATREALAVEKDGLYLYRHLLPTDVPRLAFVGSEVATISNIATHSIQATWLGKLWSGEMELPDAAEMKEEVAENKAWKRSWMPETQSRANLVLLHQIHYHDRLLKDMGLPHRRKGNNVIAELLMPYEPADYDGIVGS